MANCIILDTETANGLEQPLPYDIGYSIFNEESGEVFVERSFIIYEIFTDKALMESAYYAEKVPQYWEDIKSGKRIMKRILNLRKIILEDIKQYNVRSIGGYNMLFDRRAVKNDIRLITSSYLRWFFPDNMRYFDIWNMACTSILQTDEYITFALYNGLVSEKGNILTSAEAVYSYLINDASFTESHTGLEDVRIEREIFLAVKRSGLEYDDKLSAACWTKVRKYYKRYMELQRGDISPPSFFYGALYIIYWRPGHIIYNLKC